MLTCAFFAASACGVAVIVTLFGLGAWFGAVYVALSTIAEPPVACVVTALSVPHDAPEHPVPERDNVSTELGFDPGTGVIVATMVVETPAGKFAGAVSCRVKLLVMLTATEAPFAGSATLCAVSVTLGGAGKIPGAV